MNPATATGSTTAMDVIHRDVVVIVMIGETLIEGGNLIEIEEIATDVETLVAMSEIGMAVTRCHLEDMTSADRTKTAHKRRVKQKL